MLRLLACLLVVLSTSAAQARCTGTDLRRHITPDMRSRLDQAVARVPFAYGNHWVATKGDQSIHVVGTLHTGDSRMRRVLRNLKPHIKAADLVFLEVTSKQMENRKNPVKSQPESFLLPRGRSLQSMLSASDWQQLMLKIAFKRIDAKEATAMQPWVMSDIIVSSRCGPRGMTSFQGLDHRIEQMALHARVPVAGLEPTGTGYRAMARQPIKDQLSLLRMDLNSRKGIDDQIVTITESYFDEAVVEADILSRWTAYGDLDVSRREVGRLLRQFDAQLLDWRNHLWMPVLLNRPERKILVAVGAAHLAGRDGLLQLLQNRGYTLKRLPW